MGRFFETQCRMIVLPDSEDRMIVSSFVSTKHRNLTDTDRRTDRQTDIQKHRAITARHALQAMRTRCKQEAPRPRR